MNKTFIEVLEELEPKEMVYVGAKNGNGWFIIDPAEKILKDIKSLEKKLHADTKEQLERVNKFIAEAPSRLVHYQNNVKEFEKLLEETTGKVEMMAVREHLGTARKTLRGVEDRYGNCISQRKALNILLQNWVSLDKRSVIEVYKHETDIVSTCIMVNGNETGDWFKDEQELEMKRKKKRDLKRLRNGE